MDNIIIVVYKRIWFEYFESDIEINKIGDSYILIGIVEIEEVKEMIVSIIGEVIGSEKIIVSNSKKDSDGNS